MKHSEVLNRYVNTGQRIPEKQYDRLSKSLQKSYIRMRGVARYERWEFKKLSDDEKINFIEKNGTKGLIGVYKIYLYKFSKNKDYYISKVIDILGKELNEYDINNLLHYSDNKYEISTKIIQIKGEVLTEDDIESLINKYNLNDDLNIINYNILKIIEAKGKKLTDSEIYILIQRSDKRELIKKTLLQNGVNYKLINDVINRYNENKGLKIPLIPDNYQSMLNEIKRIKEIII